MADKERGSSWAWEESCNVAQAIVMGGDQSRDHRWVISDKMVQSPWSTDHI